MRRPIALVFAIAITTVACGGAAPSRPAASAVSATEGLTRTTRTIVAEDVVTAAGPAAPDFLMELDGGDIYVLSRDQKPVYMVFWAEW